MSVRMVLRAVGVVLWHLAPVPVDRAGTPAAPRAEEPVTARIAHLGEAA